MREVRSIREELQRFERIVSERRVFETGSWSGCLIEDVFIVFYLGYTLGQKVFLKSRY